jgi:drug/metabolite transporter, DME family
MEEATPTVARNPATLGTVYCMLSAVAYTAFYSFQRRVSESQDPLWINCIQATVAAAFLGVYLGWLRLQGRRVLPAWRDIVALAILGTVGQVGGILTIWAMAIVGVGITLVLQMGIMLGASAVLGLVVLRERVSGQQIAAIALITLSVVCFSLGAQTGNSLRPQAGGTGRIMLGIAGAVLSGLAFAVLSVGIRKIVTGTASAGATVFLLNLMGPLAIGPVCVHQLGLDGLMATPWHDLKWMLAAGPANLAALLLVTKSYQLITVVRVNVINNGLTGALTAVAGIWLFSEPRNIQVLLGMVLSLVGILLISLADSSPVEKLEALD